MDRLRIVQSIKVGKNVSDIMKLDCVRSCRKIVVSDDVLYGYRLYPLSMAHPAPYVEAVTGDWLCQQADGKWDILSENEYKKRNEVQDQN